MPQQPQMRTAIVVPISSKDGLVYTVDIIIGNQHFAVQLDTGSSNLWVPGVDCGESSVCPSIANAGVYNPGLSKTFIKGGRVFNIPYVTGKSAVIVNKEDITIGGLTFQSEFEISTAQSGFTTAVSGMLGVGYLDSAIGNVVPPFVNMFQQHQLPRIFSIYLNTQVGVDTSEMVLGGLNENRFTGAITYVKISNAGSLSGGEGKSWSVNLDQVSLGNTAIANAAIGIIDSGASLVIVPDAQAQIINTQLNPTISSDGNMNSYVVDCAIDTTSLQPVSFQIGGIDFNLNPAEYIITSASSPVCESAFRGSKYDKWILGDVFLRKYYTIYNMDEDTIGFATAVH